MSENILSEIVEVVSQHFSKDKSTISEKTNIVKDLGADSLDVLELIMLLEQKFGCTIPEEDARKIETIGDLVNYVSNLEKKNVS